MKRLALLRNQLSNTNINTSSSQENLIQVENSNGDKNIKLVKLNNPKQLNILNKSLVNTLYKTMIALDTDNETKVIILTGNGKAFAAGADLKKFNSVDYNYISRNDWDLLPIENLYYQMNKPVLAAVNGIAYGGGFELALSCDIILASDKASFSFPELKVGLFPGAGGTQRLVKLMGYHKACEYILTTKELGLEEAKQFGVINEIVPHDKLLQVAHDWAVKISQFSMVDIIASKKAMKMALETGLFAGLKTEKYLFQGIFNSEDKKIGTTSFLEKKKPVFSDK
jgi:enoyl-CoA hydratase